MTFSWNIWVACGQRTVLICADTRNSLQLLSDSEYPFLEWCFKSGTCFQGRNTRNESGLVKDHTGNTSGGQNGAGRTVTQIKVQTCFFFIQTNLLIKVIPVNLLVATSLKRILLNLRFYQFWIDPYLEKVLFSFYIFLVNNCIFA